ncbi:Imm44 family immunity protein [Sulfurovum sp. AR]|uniref:Imm44 family immunity protein n=1 Tax=Sulfurovum sp. AR TaxID=1165841 RepID=UPI00025C4801|nr:Imm44 family immunity protein [Sulfurovum sp. AR]EIF51637.1 hypothetical protein SULAR_02198 [Sulfurovum sp. AR]
MKLWMSSETSREVLNEDQSTQLRLARNFVKDKINLKIEDISYEIPLDSWDCIIVMMGDDSFEERTIYSMKKRDMDFRLKIDHAEFNSTDALGQQKLIFEMLMRSLDLLKEKFTKVKPKLPHTIYDELENLKADVLSVANSNGWI